MTEIIINLFLGVLCGSGAVLVMEMVITASLAFIDLIKEFKEGRKKDDQT